MSHGSSLPRRLSAALLFFVLATCVYRARTQSFTVDEAWAFNSFVSQPLSTMGQLYDACNHVLHTLLMKASRYCLGTGELALRLPGLVGALLYCLAVYRLTALVAGGWMQLLAVALLTLHPLVLDFLIAARGYGLALALLLWAMYCAVVYFVRGLEPKWLRRSGVLAGLAIASNLVMLIPAAALGLVLLLLFLRDGPRRVWNVIDWYGGPAVITAFVIVIIPLLPARPEHFYYGESTISGSVESLVGSVVKVRNRWPGPSSDTWVPLVSATLVPLALAALLAALVVILRRFYSAGTLLYRSVPFLLFAGTLLVSAGFVLLLHAVAGVKYPMERTGIYFIPLFIMASLLAVRLSEHRRWAWARRTTYLAAVFVALISVAQTHNRYFADWMWDAGTHRLMRRLRNEVATRTDAEGTRLGTSRFLDQTASYYRVRHRIYQLAIPKSDGLESEPYEYYLLTSQDEPLVAKLGLEVLERDSVSGEVLARAAQ